jgi:hypothetical protein
MDLNDWMGLYVMSVYQNPLDLTLFQKLIPLAISSEKNLKRLSKQETQTNNVYSKLELIRSDLRGKNE